MINWMDLLNPWILTVLAAGILLVVKSPLEKLGFPRSLELSIATILGLVFLFHFSIVVIMPLIDSQDLANGPCSDSSVTRTCYAMSADNCQTAWSYYEKECKEETLKNLNPKRATSLMGATVKDCVYKKMDRSFRSTRRTVSDQNSCGDFFSKLDQPTP